MTAIDIILPYYNGSKYIKEQLESIEKSDTDGIKLKLIIINDASSQIETEFLKKIMPADVFYLENEENLGVIKSIEKGLKLSTAQHIMLCDQDDFWLPNKIKNSLRKLKDIEKLDKPALVYTDLTIVDSDLKTIHHSMHGFYKHDHTATYPSILFHNIITGCTIIMNRELLEIALPFPKNVTMHDHWIAICAVFTGEVALLDQSTILYRQHGNNQVGAPRSDFISKLRFFKKTIPKFEKHTQAKIIMAQALADRLIGRGMIDQASLLRKTIIAINQKNIIYLIRKGIFKGSLLRILCLSVLLLLKRKYYSNHEIH